jgi:tetratricopeptide (TPR) repeat protein
MTLALFGAVIAIYEFSTQRISEGQNRSINQQHLTSPTSLSTEKRITVVASWLAAVAITIVIISVFINWDIRRLSASLILSREHDNPNLNIRAKAWEDAQAIAPERASITFKLFEAYLATAKEQYNLGNVNEAMRLLIAGRDMLLVYEQRDPLELDIQIGLSKTTSTLAEWGHEEFMDELTYRSQKLASIAPAFPTLLGTSATAMASVGLHEIAIEYAERAIATEEKTKPWSKAWYAKGRSLYALGKESEAIIALTTATEKEPGTEAAILSHKVLGEIYKERGNVALSEMHITLGNADITVTN